MTILVETLAALARRERRRPAGAATRRRASSSGLTAERIVLNGPPLETLLDDPTRDPKVEIAGAPSDGEPDLQGAGAVFVELLGKPARDDLSAAVDSLVYGLLASDPEDRLTLEQALEASRALGLEQLDAWDRERRRKRLEEDLRAALERRLEPEVQELAAELADLAPQSPWVERARGWIDVRSRKARSEAAARRRLAAALYRGQRREVELRQLELEAVLGTDGGGDHDLAVAWGWLQEHDERDERQREESRKVSRKLFLTGAPLIFAAFLIGLLAVVMWLSG